MSDINNKNHLQRKSAPSYSENSSGDVQSSSLSSATDTLQTSKIADAKIIDVTKNAKHNYLLTFLLCVIPHERSIEHLLNYNIICT